MHGLITSRVAKLVVAVSACAAVLAAAAGSAGAAPAVVTKESFTITYASSVITTEGEVTCTGFHETNSKRFPGTATEGGRDKERCVSTSGGKFTALTAGQTSNEFPGSPSYESDWFYLKGERGESIASTKVHFKVNHGDKAFRLEVYVPLDGAYPPIAG